MAQTTFKGGSGKRKRLQLQHAIPRLQNILGGDKISSKYVNKKARTNHGMQIEDNYLLLSNVYKKISTEPSFGMEANFYCFHYGRVPNLMQSRYQTQIADKDLLEGFKSSANTGTSKLTFEAALRGRYGVSAKTEKTWMFKTQYIGNDLYGGNSIDTVSKQLGRDEAASDGASVVTDVDRILGEFNQCNNIKSNVKTTNSVKFVLAFVPLQTRTLEQLHHIHFKFKDKSHAQHQRALLKEDMDLANDTPTMLFGALPVPYTRSEGPELYSVYGYFRKLGSSTIPRRKTLCARMSPGKVSCSIIESSQGLRRCSNGEKSKEKQIVVNRIF
jgi:hypothetical protein